MQVGRILFVTVVLLAWPCNGQNGLFPQFLPPNLLSKEVAPILSTTGSQFNATEEELGRAATDFSMPSQQQPQQPPQLQQEFPELPLPTVQQPFDGQPQQLPNYPQLLQTPKLPQQEPQYPPYSLEQPSQSPPQQQPTQIPQQGTQYPQKTQYPQQTPPSLSTLLSKQGPQYPQPSPSSLPSLLSQQTSQVGAVNQLASNSNISSSTKDEQVITATTSIGTNSQSGVQNTTTTILTTPTTTTAPEPEKTGMDQKNGEAESLVDYALGLAGYKDNSGDQKDTVVTPTGTPTPTPSGGDVSDCNFPATLESCDMPSDVLGYFNFNVSVGGVLASIFKPKIIALLRGQCQPGSWCLSYDEHLDIMDGMDSFYIDGPMCSVAMWSCMERIGTARAACGDKDLSFLMDSVQTLCDLSEFGLTDKRCYTRTVEALYATYVEAFPSQVDKVIDIQEDFCQSYKAKMSKTYLCADDSCSYDQKIVLERFEPWKEIMNEASAVVNSCNMTDMCQYEEDEDYLEELAEEVEEEYGDYAYDYYDSDYMDEDEEDDSEAEEGGGFGEVGDGMEGGGMGETFKDMLGVTSSDSSSSTNQQTGDRDSKKPDPETLATQENIVLGLVVVIAMAGVVLMCLAVVICKRYQTTQMGGHRGYSKLAEDESRMMHNEYS